MFGTNKLRDEQDTDRRAWQACVKELNTLMTVLHKRFDAIERGLHLKAPVLATEYALQAIVQRLDKLESNPAFGQITTTGFSHGCDTHVRSADPFANWAEAVSIDELFKDAAPKKKKKKPVPKKKPKSRK